MSYRQLFYHIVIRPKNSEPVIVQDYEEALYRYIWGFIKDKGAVLYRIGGMPDHIHMFVSLPATLSVADFMRDLKTASNKFLQEDLSSFQGLGKILLRPNLFYQRKRQNRELHQISKRTS